MQALFGHRAGQDAQEEGGVNDDDFIPRSVEGDLLWLGLWAGAIVLAAWVVLCWATAYLGGGI